MVRRDGRWVSNDGGRNHPGRANGVRRTRTSEDRPDEHELRLELQTVPRCLSYRRRASPRVPESRRRILSVQRRRRSGSRSPGARSRARRHRRSRCTPRQRHRVRVRVRPCCFYLFHAPAAQLPDVEARRLARHRPARWDGGLTVSSRARTGAAGGAGERSRSACSTWRGRIRTRTISSVDCG